MINAISLVVAMASALVAIPAWAQSGVQVTPDGQRTLVSKDVAGQRWAITLNASDGSVTGNVFSSDGSDPSFVWCNELGRSDSGSITFGCSGASRCTVDPCEVEEWSIIADVPLPESFFAASDGDTTAAVASLRRGAGSTWQGPVRPASLGRIAGPASIPSGVQVSPDRERVLISKDVGTERWAITRHVEDGTVTGNVFDPGGGPPSFVFCEQLAEGGGSRTLRCFGADACAADPCPASDDWTLIADQVNLPDSFFDPPPAVEAQTVIDAAEDGLGGEQNAFDALVLALDRGYTLPQIVRAALSTNVSVGLAGNLGPDGTISNTDGEEEEPDSEPTGRYIDLGNVNRAQSQNVGRPAGTGAVIIFDLLRRLFSNLDEPDEFAATPSETILDLERQGFGVNEVGDAVEEGRIRPDEDARVELVTDDDTALEPEDTTVQNVILISRLCGNGRLDRGEDCETGTLNGFTCESFGQVGNLSCRDCKFDRTTCDQPGPNDNVPGFCGNDLSTSGEQCDGEDLGDATCAARGMPGPGTLSCRNVREPGVCEFDLSGCRCGDGVRNHPEEQCDGMDFGPQGPDCGGRGLGMGDIRCDSSCRIVADGCSNAMPPGPVPTPTPGGGPNPGPTETPAICGDGIVGPGEDCEPPDSLNVPGVTCTDFGFSPGPLHCDGLCRFDTSACGSGMQPTPTPTPPTGPVCGNGMVEAGEECEPPGNEVFEPFMTCEDLKMGQGALFCDDECQIDTSSCDTNTNTPPSVLSVAPNPISIQVQSETQITVTFSDPDGDVTTACTEGTMGDFSGACGDFDLDGITEGQIVGTIFCGDSPGQLEFEVFVSDSRGNESNRIQVPLTCVTF